MPPRLKWLVNYVAGPLLFVLIAASIYRQVSAQPDLEQSLNLLLEAFSNGGWWKTLLLLLLMLVNWSIEARKWQLLVGYAMPVGFTKALLSVFSGVSFTMITPNRVGEFLGRVLYLPDGSRVRAAFLTFLGSLSQLASTFFFGLLGLIYLYASDESAAVSEPLLMRTLGYTTAAGIVLVLLLLFNIGWLIRMLEKVPQLARYMQYLHLLGVIGRGTLLRLVSLSVCRYAVFLLQYWLACNLAGLGLSAEEALAATAVMFLVLAIIPTIALAELGIRGQVSLFVFGLFTGNVVGILAVTGMMWLINIVIPSLLGATLVARLKLFAEK